MSTFWYATSAAIQVPSRPVDFLHSTSVTALRFSSSLMTAWCLLLPRLSCQYPNGACGSA